MNVATVKAGDRIVVAMSGGVDSSVAAALLVEQGYDVVGMMLRLWSEPGTEAANRCCTPDSLALARRVAAKLNIPFYAVDSREVFYDNVVNYFFEGYEQGITPNPCLVCNRTIRWGLLLNQARALGAEYMATGHYARVHHFDDAPSQLLRGRDRNKDQSYVLHVLDQPRLQRALFPVGEYTKAEVRDHARRFGLPTASRADSQDLCFLASGDYREFLSRHRPGVVNPGPIMNSKGEVLGEHNGLAFYTIGQRRGLGISAPEPLYVLEKDHVHNALIVGLNEELGRIELLAEGLNWISGSPPPGPFRAEVKIRYQAREALAKVHPLPGGAVRVQFEEPLRDITPGQAAVFFQEDQCLGGGVIAQ